MHSKRLSVVMMNYRLQVWINVIRLGESITIGASFNRDMFDRLLMPAKTNQMHLG